MNIKIIDYTYSLITRTQARKICAQSSKPSTRQQGAQPSHKGVSRKPAKPDEIKDSKPDKCTNCGSKDLIVTSIDTNDRTEIIQQTKTTQHNRMTCKCNNCGEEEIQNTIGIPKHGKSGFSVVEKVVEDYIYRVVIAKIQKKLMRLGIFLATGTIQNILDGIWDSMFPIALFRKRVRFAAV